MVATIRNLTSSSATVEYFRHEAGYYIGLKGDAEALRAKGEEHREASAWHGSGLEALGLKPGARVSSRAFEELLQGHVPGTEIRLGRVRHGGHEHRPGFDLTFSAPKSVSLAALLPTERHSRGDRLVKQAHDEAVRATLNWVEKTFLETRGWDPETGRRPRVKAPFMAAALFRHIASRNLDPQLHTHAVIINVTRDADGRWRSVDPVALHRNARLIGAYYRDQLARNLIARKYSIVPAMAGRIPSFDIAGLGRELCDAFSTRRREILAYVEDRGWNGSEAQRQIATLATRGRKAEPLKAMLRTLWRERAEALGFGAISVSRSREGVSLPPVPSALEIVGRTVSRLEERYPVFPERELEALALSHSPGRHSLDEIRKAVASMVRDGHLVEAQLRGSDRSYVTDRTLKAERRVIAAMKAGLGAGEALAGADEVAAHLAGAGLTAGQEEAVRTVLLSRDRIVGVQGWAGTGKTTMLRHVRELAGERPVLGLAPEARAARVLERESGMNVRTLQWFLTRCGSALGDEGAEDRLRQMFGGSLVVLDEASLVSTDRMGSLMRIADRLGVARLVLVGDTGQLRAVEAGQPFLQLQRAGMTTVQMDEVRRQRNPVLRAAVLAARSGEPGKAVELLGSSMHEVAFDELGQEAARIWLALAPEARERTLLLALTHALRAEINGTVRAALADEGVLRGKALTIERLVSLGMTGAEKGDVRNYREGDAVMFHQDMVNYRVKKDEALTVTGIEGERVLLRHPDGGPRHIKPAGGVRHDLEVFETRPIEIRAGDRIRWTRNDNGRELINGEQAEVAAIARGRVRLVLEDGRKVSLQADDPQLRHIDYAWSSTVRGAQGSTADGVIAVLDSSQRALTDQSTFYVEISRARDRAVVLTDNLDELVEVLEANTGERATALDAVGEPIEMDVQALAQRIPLKGRICTPDEEWAAVEARARREGTVAFRAEGYDALMERVRALAEQPDLPAATREVLDRLLAYDRACREGDAAAREFLGLLAAHAETRRGLEEAAGAAGRAIAGLEGYGDWRALSARLIANGEVLLADLAARAGDAGGEIRDGLGRLPALHTLDDAHRAFDRLRDEVTARAAAEDTIPYYAEGHDALLESARALAGMADLPAHALEAAGEVIAEATACERRRAEIVALRAEATQLLEKRGEMEAALSEVPEDQLVPYTRDADYALWSADCEAAAERWQAMRDEPDTWDPHLDRPGVGKAALEADLDRLGELRGHDEAWAALCVMHGGIAERARAEGKATFDLPEWNELADKAGALLARPGLPEAAARGARAILDYDRRCREVDAFLASAEAHGARWDALRAEAARGENVSIIDLPGYAPLTEAEGALRETGEAILADRTGTHLTRVQDGAALVTAALERLESHALLDRCVAAMNGLEEAAGGAWPSFPGDSPHKALEDAEALAKERGLEDEARRRLEAAIEEQAALLAQLAAIRQLLRDMEALDRHEQEFGESAARYEELPRSLIPGWEDFRAAHEAFPEAARPPLEDAAFEEFRQTRPDLVDQIREAVGIARDRLALAASELDLDTAMGGAGYMEEAGAWRLDADDFTNACGRDAVKGDLVCFSVGADALPGGDGEEREVRIIAELVTRSAKMSDLDDPCTLETLWRSDGGPTGQIRVPLGTLAGDGCTRAVRGPGDDDEAARSWAVDEQAWKLEEQRRELLEAIRRERHLSMSMKM
ncbi:MAG: relaxase domain-containing protein [Rhodospirillaceae bacterium]|nr:relaxase domain-containing protein [Rhodospirillaceae bacterium]